MIDRKDAPLAAALGAASFTWYAMPDVVRSRGVRTLLKGLLLAKMAALYALTRPPRPETNGPDAVDELLSAANEAPGRALAVGGSRWAWGSG
ncbi:hypothetical protein G7070_03185 [Propioniciclava coleopterorum]|uniref:Uncharacterized protein n=1 Tax=Propioniciclava coleopterorum TaxID=2714937 RepID=A0A6G7Y3R9_9ACTN|nr:hypothetical protein [Propioniciclava coleopterorum]QIK71470.1 hypothetical protein G7070_03185 [Propioniciclava coleopterorum]